jgi:carbon monoxide dehydrogenase subunit G
MKIESEKVDVNATPDTIYSFLTDSTNLIHLLPKDTISDWKASAQECSFKVQGGVTISLAQNGGEGTHKVFMKSGEKSPFPFTLTIYIHPNSTGSNGYLLFDGEVNMFLKLIVEKPLTGLFNHMATKLRFHFEGK